VGIELLFVVVGMKVKGKLNRRKSTECTVHSSSGEEIAKKQGRRRWMDGWMDGMNKSVM